jgi:hypothetical protein
MAAEPQKNRLPFEPSKKRQKPIRDDKKPPEKTKKPDKQLQSATQSRKDKPAATVEKSEKPRSITKEEMAIPKVVSNRMARRMAIFCGLPTALGISTFVVSYVIVSQGWFKLPHIAVVLVSMGFLGLGVLGLTYGALSASWDEERVGGKLGFSEFTTNWQRMVSAWRSTRQS